MRSLVRAGAFVRKEIAETLRRPGLLAVLVLAPFAILLVFGLALDDEDPDLRTWFVEPEEPAFAEEVREFAAEDHGQLEVEEITADEQEALAQLRAGEIDLVVAFPDEPQEQLADGERAVVTVHHDQIDPVEVRAVELATWMAVDRLNRQLLVRALHEGEEQREELAAVAEDGDDLGSQLLQQGELEPETVVSPFTGEVDLAEGTEVGMADFYAPAVVVLLLQHLMVTFLALSHVRERQLGVLELYELSPLRPGEVLVGKSVGHLLVGAAVVAALTAALVYGLGTPMTGPWWLLATVLAATLLASAGLGMLVAVLARTDTQAVQYAMMILLATLFLGGFLVSLERFVLPAQWLAWLLPATHGISATRSVMLRGHLDDLVPLVALGVLSVALFAISWVALRRRVHATGLPSHR